MSNELKCGCGGNIVVITGVCPNPSFCYVDFGCTKCFAKTHITFERGEDRLTRLEDIRDKLIKIFKTATRAERADLRKAIK